MHTPRPIATAIVTTSSAILLSITGCDSAHSTQQPSSYAQVAKDQPIDDQIKQIIAVHLGIKTATITPTQSFINDLGCDSLDTVELIMAFEDHFAIAIPDADADKLHTVADATTYLKQNATSR